MSNRLEDMLKHFAGYFTTSLLGTVVDTLVLWVCSHWLFPGSYFGRNILSPTLSFECAVLVNFTNSYFFVWKDRIPKHSSSTYWKHYAAYNASCTGAFLLKMFLLQLVLLITGFDVVICNLIALCFSGTLNFLMNEKVIFKKKKAIPIPDASNYPDADTAAGTEAE